MALVGFFGSRSLPSSPLVSRVVASVLASGRGVAVGCASGGDALALSAALAAGSSPLVFAVGGPSGAGFWRGSALGLVRRAAAAGCPVRWWAGGAASLSLRRRLRARSVAFVAAVSASGPGAGLVGFVRGGWSASPGSWGSVGSALAAGLPVVVFPVGCPVSAFPCSFRGVGRVRWLPAGSGVWAAGFRAVVENVPVTTVVHCKRDEHDVYIGRPSRWGNPFAIGKDGNREQVIEKYRQWIMNQPDLLAELTSLRGKRLGCWCAPQPCHGDVLAELAEKLGE